MESAPHNNHGLISTIILTSVLAGTLDALAAIVVYNANPIKLFQFISSGVFGVKEAFAGGLSMAFIGLVFHFIIALFWTTIFFILYPKIRLMSFIKIIAGLIYGLVIWLGMNLMLLPLTRVPTSPFDWLGVLKGMVILMLTVGLPISLLANKYYTQKKKIITQVR